MTSVAALIQAVHEAGGRLHPMGDRLKVRAPRPLADDLISELRAHKPALLAFLANQQPAAPPRAWVAGTAKLIGSNPPVGYTSKRWKTLARDAEKLISTWAGQAAALGWTDMEIFGAHRTAPATRYDAAGLVVMMNGDEIVALTDTAATIKSQRGTTLTHQRRLTAPEGEVVFIWDTGR